MLDGGSCRIFELRIGHDLFIGSLCARRSHCFLRGGLYISDHGGSLGGPASISTHFFREVTMIVMELQYDAVSRTFLPLDQEAGRMFTHGELFLAIISESGNDVYLEPVDFNHASVAHA
jgi:hypothetical protein